MTALVLQTLGGLGLFLLGTTVLTEGLRALAGDATHRALLRFTKSPASGAATGAALTAVLQSSSVTTVATVGFVGAGLLAFPQALGVVFGANIGTTATGWMVALLGFKLGIGPVVLPLLLAGVLLRLFGRGRVASMGWAVAGFALLFLGIEALQAGMAGFEGAVTPDDFPGDTAGGRVLLVLIGAVVTLVTQSSSAGVATALTAVDAGALTLPQAAAMVIGMDVGTTSTTALATIGASAAARRTGYAHVVYNLMTAVAAFALLDPYVLAVDALVEGGAAAHPTLALVGFHTAFNGIGVVAALPFTNAFARLMTRLVRERGPALTARLDPALLRDARTAALALSHAVREVAAELFDGLERALRPDDSPALDEERLARISHALIEARHFAERIATKPDDQASHRSLLASIHAIDHLDRSVARARRSDRIAALRTEPHLRELASLAREAIGAAVPALRMESERPAAAELERARDVLRAARRPYRERVVADVPNQDISLDEAILRLDAIRWLHRMVYHAWRIVLHLEGTGFDSSPTVEPASEAWLDSEETA